MDSSKITTPVDAASDISSLQSCSLFKSHIALVEIATEEASEVMKTLEELRAAKGWSFQLKSFESQAEARSALDKCEKALALHDASTDNERRAVPQSSPDLPDYVDSEPPESSDPPRGSSSSLSSSEPPTKKPHLDFAISSSCSDSSPN